MMAFPGINELTARALAMKGEEVLSRSIFETEVFADGSEMAKAMAASMVTDYARCLDSGKEKAVMIVPVGPVGQYPLFAAMVKERKMDLSRLTLVIMDEYLDSAGKWIPEENPLSFRGHVRRNLTDLLPEGNRPEIIIPDPADPGRLTERCRELGGIDYAYAGVGITGHLAFNEPVPGRDNADWFAGLSTRVVSLLPESRLINSVTAAGGNVFAIPEMAVTVGMKEILSAKQVRVWMNRTWQCAAVRRMLFGPVTAAYPASLLQRHGRVSLGLTREVLDVPIPVLR